MTAWKPSVCTHDTQHVVTHKVCAAFFSVLQPSNDCKSKPSEAASVDAVKEVADADWAYRNCQHYGVHAIYETIIKCGYMCIDICIYM